MSRPTGESVQGMDQRLPFLSTRLPTVDAYLPYLREIDERHWYSNFGPLVSQFETELLGQLFDGQGAVTTVGNCTLGLILALKAVAKPRARYVIMPSFTFAATPLAAVWAGFKPYFVDISPDDWACSTAAIDAALTALGDDVACVMPYATFGNAIELDYYESLAARGVPVVIDAAPGLGARNPDGSAFGSGFSGCIVFSMHATKPFGIGEGGLVYSGNADTVAEIRQLSNFGFSRPGECVAEGLNAKLPEIGAAVGLAVLQGYRDKLNRLDSLFSVYLEAIDATFGQDIELQRTRGRTPHQHLPLLLPAGTDAAGVAERLSSLGYGSRRYFAPACHEQAPFTQNRGDALQMTEQISERVLCLPLWDGMQSDQPGQVVETLAALLAH